MDCGSLVHYYFLRGLWYSGSLLPSPWTVVLWFIITFSMVCGTLAHYHILHGLWYSGSLLSSPWTVVLWFIITFFIGECPRQLCNTIGANGNVSGLYLQAFVRWLEEVGGNIILIMQLKSNISGRAPFIGTHPLNKQEQVHAGHKFLARSFSCFRIHQFDHWKISFLKTDWKAISFTLS